MRTRRKTRVEQEVVRTDKGKQPTEQGPTSQSRPVHPIASQRAIQSSRTLRPEAVLQLQGTIGNQAMGELIASRKQSEGASSASIQRTEREEKALIEGNPIQEATDHRTRPPVQRPTRDDQGLGAEPAVPRAKARLRSNSPKSRLATPRANVVQRLFYEKTASGLLIWHNERADPAQWEALQERVPSRIPLVRWQVYRRKARDLKEEAVEELQKIVKPEMGIRGEDRGNYDLACWNWALHGFKPVGVFPQHVFDYLAAQMRPGSPEAKSWKGVEAVPEKEGRGWIKGHQDDLDRIVEKWREIYMEEFDPHELSKADHAAVVQAVRLIAQANGLELAGEGEDSPYYLCMHYKVADGVTFDHWWLEVHGRTIETFPGMDIQIYKGKQSDEGKKEVRLPLVRLLPEHVDKIHSVLGVAALPE